MTEDADTEAVIEGLREQLAETRRKRMAAQKAVAAVPNLETAMDRTSRDRSTGATDETDRLRQEILTLRDDIMVEVRGADRNRELLSLVDKAYPNIEPRARLIKELNKEARWRKSIGADERSTALRMRLPQAEEIH